MKKKWTFITTFLTVAKYRYCKQYVWTAENFKENKRKIHNTLTHPDLLYGVIKARDARRVTVGEMKHMRKAAEHTWIDYKSHTETAKEVNINRGLEKVQDYRRNGIQHVNRMPHNRLPRKVKYRPKGRRNQGRPLKRLLDV
jgi:uncharacterized protein YcaQ